MQTEWESISQCYIKDNHLTKSLDPKGGGKGVDWKACARLLNNHLMDLRLIEFEVIILRTIDRVSNLSGYSVRMGWWHNWIVIVCIFAYFTGGIKRVQTGHIIQKWDGVQSRCFNNTSIHDSCQVPKRLTHRALCCVLWQKIFRREFGTSTVCMAICFSSILDSVGVIEISR